MSSAFESAEVVATDDCLSTTVDGESVILHMEAGKYYGFNEVGTFIWESVQEPKTVDEVCQDVMSEYDVGYEQCRTDVEELVEELVDKDLARIEGPE